MRIEHTHKKKMQRKKKHKRMHSYTMSLLLIKFIISHRFAFLFRIVLATVRLSYVFAFIVENRNQ